MKYVIKDFPERYFIGVEYPGGITKGTDPKIGQLWQDFLYEDLKMIIDIPNYDKFIGLDCYPPDFKESKNYDYYALLETKSLIKRDGFVSKKIPSGSYILFEVEYDYIMSEIARVYQYVKDNNIKIHFGFDYEDFIKGEDYTKDNAKLNFVLKLEE